MGKRAPPADPRRSPRRAREGLQDGPSTRPLRAAGAEKEAVTTALKGVTAVIPQGRRPQCGRSGSNLGESLTTAQGRQKGARLAGEQHTVGKRGLSCIDCCACLIFAPFLFRERGDFTLDDDCRSRCQGPVYQVRKQKFRSESDGNFCTNGKRAKFYAGTCPYFPKRRRFCQGSTVSDFSTTVSTEGPLRCR